jgi:hypothetical protein
MPVMTSTDGAGSAALTAAAPELAATAPRIVRVGFPNGLYVHHAEPGDAPVRPRDRHPAFYGSYDWHSAAVEMHWVLLRLLRVAGTAGAGGRDHRRVRRAPDPRRPGRRGGPLRSSR